MKSINQKISSFAYSSIKIKLGSAIKTFFVTTLLTINACSFANKSTVIVPINSNPSGANIYIDGKNFGQTPAFVELTPNKNYKASISKLGYNTANVDMETWYSVRDGADADGGRCMADVASFIVPYLVVLLFAPEKCGSFKQSDYFVDLTGGGPLSYLDPAPQNSNQNPMNDIPVVNNGAYNQYQNSNQQNPVNSEYYVDLMNGKKSN